MTTNNDMMPEGVDLQQKLEDVLDWMCELPEYEIRQMFRWNSIPQSVDYRWAMGGTEYTVVSHYDKESGECLMDKIDRLLESEVAT